MKRISLSITIILYLLCYMNVYALELDLYSNNAILYNMKEDNIIYEKNSHEKVSIASLTKIMTGIVAIENINNLDDPVTLTTTDFKGLIEANASQAGFRVGEVVTYRDLLYGLMLPSGADAAQALTRNIAGSNEKFIELMNNKAQELKLVNTHYENPTGLDDDNHYSTVSDVLTVLKYAYQNEEFKTIITTQEYTTSNKRLTFKSTLSKVQNMEMDYLKGGKTGSTGDAGLCLATIANYDDTDFLLVTAKAEYSTVPKNFLDHKTIHEYIRDHYNYQEIVNKNDILVSLKTKYLKEDKIDFYSPKTINKYLDDTFDKKNVSYKYQGKKIINSKMKKGEKLGTVKIYYHENILAEENIILSYTPKFSLLKYVNDNKVYILIINILIIGTIIIIKK